MPVLQVEIPKEIDNAINSISSNKNEFILDAVKQKLIEFKFKLIEEKLIEGYKSSRHENLSLMEDFKHSDPENWNEY